MPFAANVLNVMIASPGDVEQERTIVSEELHAWNDVNASSRRLVLRPVKWETHSTPEIGEHAQTIINRDILNDADIVIAIFWTRIGTPTEDYESGTVEEIKLHAAAHKIAKVYFSSVPVLPESLNNDQYEQVKAFKSWCQSHGLYAGYRSLDQFRRDVRRHLELELNKPKYQALLLAEPFEGEKSEAVSRDALRLLTAAASHDGSVMYSELFEGTSLRAGTEEMMDGTPRSVAKWTAILNDLLEREALERESDSVYQVTSYGYELVDKAAETPKKSAFDEAQLESVRSRTAALQYFERDLLRFLVINGDSRETRFTGQR
jgi:hypothetical protein